MGVELADDEDRHRRRQREARREPRPIAHERRRSRWVAGDQLAPTVPVGGRQIGVQYMIGSPHFLRVVLHQTGIRRGRGWFDVSAPKD
jgi:hypothetical protein